MKRQDLAQMVSRDLLANLLGRKGFDWAWDDVDPDIQEEIRAELLALVSNRLRKAGVADDELAPSSWKQGMQNLVGKWVRVTIAQEPQLVERVGRLHGFSDDGEVMLWDGVEMWHLWPNLECREEEYPGG